MTKNLGIALAAFALFAVPMVFASADVDLQTNGFQINDRESAVINPGDDIDVEFTSDIDGDSSIEFVRVRITPDNSSNWVVNSCVELPNEIGGDQFDQVVKVNVDTPSDMSSGGYDVEVNTYGEEDGDVFGCGGGDNNSADDEDYENRLFVTNDDNVTDDNGSGSGEDNDDGVGNGNNGGTPSENDAAISALQSQIAALVAQLAGLTGVVASMAPDAICAQKPADTMSLQSFFVGQGLMTQAEMNTGPGIFGPKTTRANNAFNTLHKCR